MSIDTKGQHNLERWQLCELPLIRCARSHGDSVLARLDDALSLVWQRHLQERINRTMTFYPLSSADNLQTRAYKRPQ